MAEAIHVLEDMEVPAGTPRRARAGSKSSEIVDLEGCAALDRSVAADVIVVDVSDHKERRISGGDGSSLLDRLRRCAPEASDAVIRRAAEVCEGDFDGALLSIETKYDIVSSTYLENTPQKFQKAQDQGARGPASRGSKKALAGYEKRSVQPAVSISEPEVEVEAELELDLTQDSTSPPKCGTHKQLGSQASSVVRKEAASQDTTECNSRMGGLVFSQDADEAIVTAARELLSTHVCSYSHDRFPHAVIWQRSQKMPDGSDARLLQAEHQRVAVCLSGCSFVSHIAESTLSNMTADLKASFPGRKMDLLVYGLETFVRKQFRAAPGASGVERSVAGPLVSKEGIADARCWLLVERGIVTHVVKDAKSCAQCLVDFTAILEEDDNGRATGVQSLFDATTRTKKRAVRDGDHDSQGPLLSTIFQGMLMQIPGVSWDVAKALATGFESISSIATAIRKRGSKAVEGDMKALDVSGPSSNRKRKVGASVAGKVVDLFTCVVAERGFR